MQKTQDEPNNEPTEIDEMFRKLEESGDCSGIENFSSKTIPKIAKIINKLHPEQNSFTSFVKKDEDKENTIDNIGYYFYTSTEPVIDLGNKKQPLEVSISTTEQENEQLLHFLFNISKSAKEDPCLKQLPSDEPGAETMAKSDLLISIAKARQEKEKLEKILSKHKIKY